MKVNPKKNILFVSHNASRTGAPIVLITFLDWLKRNREVGITVLLKDGGELENEFAKFGGFYSLAYSKKLLFYKIWALIYRKFYKREKVFLPRSIKKLKIDLIYLNTIESLEILAKLKSVFKCPVTCHIHENEFVINYYYPDLLSTANKALIRHYIAVSESTRNNLIKMHSIPGEKISLCYEFIPVEKIQKTKRLHSDVRREIGITDEFVVGGSGATSWRKGIDLFMRLAVTVNKLMPANNIKFVWVGSTDDFYAKSYNYEKYRLKIENKIIFTGSKERPQDYFQIFDIFCLTSREDPFPLVCLEAASLSKRIICFDDAGGIPEFINRGAAGSTVPYGDVEAMAKEILKLYDDPQAVPGAGNNNNVLIKEYDVDSIAPEIFDVIQKFMDL